MEDFHDLSLVDGAESDVVGGDEVLLESVIIVDVVGAVAAENHLPRGGCIFHSRAGAKEFRLEAQTHRVADLLLHGRLVGGAKADGDGGADDDEGVRVGSDDSGNIGKGAPDVGHVESAGMRVERGVDAEENEMHVVEDGQIVRDVMHVVAMRDLLHAVVACFDTDHAMTGVGECKRISMTNNPASDLDNGGGSHLGWSGVVREDGGTVNECLIGDECTRWSGLNWMRR